MNPQKHSASVAEEQMLAHFRAHAPQQPAPPPGPGGFDMRRL
ncbi:hypothetical protein K3Z99_19555, partial [Pseudomonas aeruginosa]|nr:hypothetical protein [Pseudomonas aeruginosa]